MDIRHLEYFVEVAREKSFTKASQNMHITQPTVSKMIKTLEDELGVILFQRAFKQLELTDSGKAIFNQAQEIIGAFHHLTIELGDLMNLKKGSIRIGLPPTAGSIFFPRIMGEFKKKYPDIEIKLFEIGSKKVERGVEEGTLDLGITCTPPSGKDRFETVTLVKDPLMLAVAPSHSLAGRESVELSELCNESFVMYPEDFSLYDRIKEQCSIRGFQPKIICESSQWNFLVELAAAELGIALIPNIICQSLD
ncbi:MAG: LysR family transcriptional regulator, partial [Gorillibacterium sp.]|nr:LysR family transcriptional regulator [Gorillibacterium sp.]